MIPTSHLWLNTLRLGLLIGTIGWCVALYFTFAPWNSAADQLYAMGAGQIPYRPMYDYWLRMASSVFGCIGLGCALALLDPNKYAGFIRLLGPFHLLVGITLTIAARANHLTPSLHPTFIPDITFCYLTCLLIQLPLIQATRDAR